MACVHMAYKIAICLLLLAAVRSSGIQPRQIIYVDEGNGILGPSCWKNGPEISCSLEVALDGAEQHNSTVVLLDECWWQLL